MVKRVNTKKLAEQNCFKWYELDCVRQTTILSLANELISRGLDKEVVKHYIQMRINFVLDAMFK